MIETSDLGQFANLRPADDQGLTDAVIEVDTILVFREQKYLVTDIKAIINPDNAGTELPEVTVQFLVVPHELMNSY